jgi:hypothetical protein
MTNSSRSQLCTKLTIKIKTASETDPECFYVAERGSCGKRSHFKNIEQF